MEMNKGEAEKSRDIGKKYLRAGNFEKALKFLEKSHSMYPLPGVDAMIARAKEELSNASNSHTSSSSSSSSSANNVRRREPHTTANTARAASEEPPSRPYTADQLNIVRKIKACKTHYEVLSVSTTADENEIKKAYRKLALKLHPDKNSAPGAEDAFKAVGKAFTILSDADKRAHYDRYGDAAPETTSASHHRGRRGGAYYDDDISPEEIFNMFFGGGFHPRHRRQPHAQRRPQSHAQEHEQRHPLAQLVQLLPILLIFMLSMFSMPSQPEIPFSLQPTAQFNIQRTTQMANVAKGIPYYVNREFDRKYTSHWRDLARVEQMVEQFHISRLSENCENEKVKQKRMIYRARQSNENDRERLMRQALEFKMPACDQLRSLRKSRDY